MRRFLSADYLIPVNASPIKNGIIVLDDKDEILDILPGNNLEGIDMPIERHQGIIVPGFINSHCHIELSHLRKKIKEKTGLIDFIKQVARGAKYEQDEILAAIEMADRVMYKNGIVAVGDISNTANSKVTKEKSKIYYHTFCEIFEFEPSQAKNTFRKGIELCEQFSPLATSITPHAPYSVSKELFRFIRLFCKKERNLISVHNQESEEENKFFRYRAGQFVDFYAFINKNIDFFKAQARNSLRSTLPLLPQDQRILLVHNTYTSFKDINFVDRYRSDVTWCLCPKANLYIEGRLRS